MIGKIKDDELHFYLKDHLGSIRATIYDNKLMSAQDYDAWGYILEGRTYESEQGKFKFTGKERDEESFYDYFGARYYDARVGRWGQVEPLFDKFISFSPYSYSVLNPLKFTDILGQGPKITISGNEIDINFSIFYTTKEVDAVFGLDQTQINVLETMSQNAHEDWSGDFVIGGELYSINVNVELTLSSQPFDIFASEKQRLPGGYNLIGDFTWDPQASEQLAHERGVGMSGNVLMMLSGDDLKPYKSSGSHEAGHAMSLGHEDATSRPYRYGSKLEKIWSVMGKVTIYEGKEYREKPTSNDWSKIFERTKINLKKNQSTYINN